jgi:hypothetical protein
LIIDEQGKASDVIQMGVGKNDIPDSGTLGIGYCHRQTPGVYGNDIVHQQARKMLPR